MRNSWTDDRLDGFSKETYRRFDEVDKRFEAIDKRFDNVEADIKQLGREMNARFDSLQRTMLRFSGTLVIALIGFMITQVGP